MSRPNPMQDLLRAALPHHEYDALMCKALEALEVAAPKVQAEKVKATLARCEELGATAAGDARYLAKAYYDVVRGLAKARKKLEQAHACYLRRSRDEVRSTREIAHSLGLVQLARNEGTAEVERCLACKRPGGKRGVVLKPGKGWHPKIGIFNSRGGNKVGGKLCGFCRRQLHKHPPKQEPIKGLESNVHGGEI